MWKSGKRWKIQIEKLRKVKNFPDSYFLEFFVNKKGRKKMKKFFMIFALAFLFLPKVWAAENHPCPDGEMWFSTEHRCASSTQMNAGTHGTYLGDSGTASASSAQ